MQGLSCLEDATDKLPGHGDPALRRRANARLNKGEARNALARAIFFNRLGEVRDRTFENQAYRASGLNLLVSAVILWTRGTCRLRSKTSGNEGPTFRPIS